MESSVLVLPELSQKESYHVFCSYSSTDYDWTHGLIQRLEVRGLRVCDHERDFTPGRSILENMTESIEQSQKVMLVLSAEFLRSRWCLLEANMSLFRDCLQRKPIVPVLLQRDVSIPLHLSHLTYLDVQNPDFIQQLLRVLCTPNQELQASTVVPYQPPSLYNGKSLEPLPAINEEELYKFDCGVWSDMVPDQLRPIIQQPERYREAIEIINTVSPTKVRFRTLWAEVIVSIAAIIVVLCAGGLCGITIYYTVIDSSMRELKIIAAIGLLLFILWIFYKAAIIDLFEKKRILHELQKAIGQANSLLFEENVLIGSQSNIKLLLVYVFLDSCRQELSALSQDHELELFHKTILKYSCAYTCCLAKRFFPFRPTSNTGHLDGTICFCQYVSYQRSIEETRKSNGCSCC